MGPACLVPRRSPAKVAPAPPLNTPSVVRCSLDIIAQNPPERQPNRGSSPDGTPVGPSKLIAVAAVRAAALAAFDAGLAVIPPREDGSKRPDGKWKDFQDQ